MSKKPLAVAIALADDVESDVCQQFMTEVPNLLSILKDTKPLEQTHSKPGLQLALSEKNQLKEPLNQLHRFAQKAKCDFVIGLVASDGSPLEEICFFGHNEGKPDVFEIYCYLTGN